MEYFAEGCIIVPVGLIVGGIGWAIAGTQFGGYVGGAVGLVVAAVWVEIVKAKNKEKRAGGSLPDLGRNPSVSSPPPKPTPSAPPPPPPPTEMLYLLLDGKAEGPFTTTQVESLIHFGTASLDTPCCVVGQQQWQPLRSFAQSS